MILKLYYFIKMFSNYRPLFVIIITLGSSIPLFAQHSIEGRVIDENGEPLTYANVVLLSPADSTLQYFDVADKEGYYHIKNIKPGNYLMQYSFVTKEIIYEKVIIPSDLGEDFGDKVMQTAMMDEVLVTAEYVPIRFNQDTVTFNAKAFKTKTGAVVEDLLKKIPGIEVDKTGNIKALGEDVTQVLVEGKEFFGKDPKVATKNLPADAIDEVQVFDKKSEEAEFMGIDDGVRDRTINLMLNEEGKKGYFGNVDVGGGTGDHYKTGGKVYRFSSKFQSAALGMYNNINQFRFTGKDDDFGQQVSGLNTTVAGGINLLYNPTKYNRYYMSYFASSKKSILDQQTSTEHFLKDGSYNQIEDLAKNERNTPHKTNFGMRHRFSKRHNIILNGHIDISSNRIDNELFTDTRLNNTLVNNLDNTSNNESYLSNVNVRGVDIVKINGDKTQVKTELSAKYNHNTSGLDWTNTTTIYNPYDVTSNDHYQDNGTDDLTISVNPALVQKIRQFWHLNANIAVGSNNRDLNREQGFQEQADIFIDSLSADFGTNESFVRPSISLQRSTDKSQVNFIFGTSWSQFDKVLNNRSIGKTDYFHFLPGFRYRNNYQKGRRIELRYMSSVNMPGLNQLLPATNTANKLSLYQGNIDLKPEYMHNASLRWSLFDRFSFTSLSTLLSAGYTKDQISISQTINEDLTRISTPVNVPDYYSASTYAYFSTPIRALGLKVNAMNRESWSKGTSIINSEENIQNTLRHAFDLNFENRRQEKMDIRIGGSVSFTDVKFSIAKNSSYFNTSYYTDISFPPNEQWSFEMEASVVNYNSQ
ncbi:MAG: outer membrane beta-barrel protein, partial [Candidatus Marinimicrobia bacterium]|nr:outer membrane beta-barrel protein [Candidatus Neomarinimicrobiota bacterium]